MSDYTLALEAATARGSAALLRGSEVIAEREVALRAEDEERLMPAAASCCDEFGISPRDLARVVCGEGPGSFTSLRVAASIAKGIAAGAGCPLLVVSSLVLTVAAARPVLPEGQYLSVLDAQRDEYFALLVDVTPDGGVQVAGDGRLEILAAAALGELGARYGGRIIGPGQEIDAFPRAPGVASGLQQIIAAGPVDLVTWEPVYGRAPEAQVRWERTHGRPLAVQ